MYGIGELSRLTGIKVTTIRYFEAQGLLDPPGRTHGNQRRYGTPDVERLKFIRHARDLGFDQTAIAAFLDLAGHPERPCHQADLLAARQLQDVRQRIAALKRLEASLEQVVASCSGGRAADCSVLMILGDHDICASDHLSDEITGPVARRGSTRLATKRGSR